MSIEKLKRVCWRLRSSAQGQQRFSNGELERVIILECGTDWRTYTSNRRALIKVKFIKPYKKKHIDLTGLDLTI